MEIVDAETEWPLVPIGSPTGIALPADYDGRKGDFRYAWAYVDYDDPDLSGDTVGRIFQIENDVVKYAGLPCDPENLPLCSPAFPLMALRTRAS